MATQGFVSKNDRLEKADRKKDQPWLMPAGNKIPNITKPGREEVGNPHLSVTLPEVNRDYTGLGPDLNPI
jgi:hypothetical protein